MATAGIDVVLHFMKSGIFIHKDWLLCLELLEMWSDSGVQNLISVSCTIEIAVDCSQRGLVFIGRHPSNHYRPSKCLWPWLNTVLIVILAMSLPEKGTPINMVEPESRFLIPPYITLKSYVSVAMLSELLHTFPFVPDSQWSLLSEQSVANPCDR